MSDELKREIADLEEEFNACQSCGSLSVVDKKKAIVQHLINTGNVSAACAANGISRNKFYPWTRKDPAFSNAVNLAKQIFNELNNASTTAGATG